MNSLRKSASVMMMLWSRYCCSLGAFHEGFYGSPLIPLRGGQDCFVFFQVKTAVCLKFRILLEKWRRVIFQVIENFFIGGGKTKPLHFLGHENVLYYIIPGGSAGPLDMIVIDLLTRGTDLFKLLGDQFLIIIR